MTKYVSFSLWGGDPIYCIGAVKNALLMDKIYPDWKMILFYDNSVPQSIIERLNDLNVITVNASSFDVFGAFWRFFAHSIDDCEYVVFRDTDSRISKREYSAVQEWIDSGKTLHVMRDHPAHRIPFGNNKPGILAGMWGLKKTDYDMEEKILDFVVDKKMEYGIDQSFLASVYDTFNEDMMIHDEFSDGNPFPSKREGKRFIGEKIGIDDNPLTNDWTRIP